jgi:large subunit ribosomal protein L23
MLKPVLTEKTTNLARDQNKYTFLVNYGMTKDKIRKIVSATFGVKVKDITTIRIYKKTRKKGRSHNLRHDLKKAIVTLPEKEKIEIFDVGEKQKK